MQDNWENWISPKEKFTTLPKITLLYGQVAYTVLANYLDQNDIIQDSAQIQSSP